MKNRFYVSKIGLLNFWLYDEEEYDFYGGNLILRGINGSGKSVTMQSFIPLILDGNKSPDRLDPFGSKERKIEDYIIGDSESIQKEESTAYLYMELKNPIENKYITIGLGFRGRKGKPVDSWGFALKDGKRIGKDFYLYKDKYNKIPLSKKELKSRIGNFNEFTETTKDYKAMVNRIIFGFDNLDTYDEFIKLLLQLRSNKLSKDYKPTNLVNVLNTVLQPLSEDDLRPLSEAVEQMNKTKEQVENLEQSDKKLKIFLNVYSNYNNIVLLSKARNFFKQNMIVKENNLELNKLKLEIENCKDHLNKTSNELAETEEKIEIEGQKKRDLESTGLTGKIEELSTIENKIETLNNKIEELNEKIEQQNDKRIDATNKLRKIENDCFNLEKEIKDIGYDMDEISNDIYFDEIAFFTDSLLNNIENATPFNAINASLDNYEKKVSMLKDNFVLKESILKENDRTRESYDKLVNEYKIIEEKISNLENELKDSILLWEEDFINKQKNNQELILTEDEKTKIYSLMNNYTDTSYQQVKEIYYNRKYLNRGIYFENNLKLDNLKNVLNESQESLYKELIEVKKHDDYEVKINDDEQILLNYLDKTNISYMPLYKCIEFKSNLTENMKNNIEASLLGLNILNAKIVSKDEIPRIIEFHEQGNFLIPGIKKKKNLSDYFDVIENNKFDKNYVENILTSISIDPSDSISIGTDGTYHFDFLKGTTSKKYQQKYIGYLKRQEEKKKKIVLLEEEIENNKNKLNDIDNKIQQNLEKIEIIEKEVYNLPTIELITSIEKKINAENNSLDWNDNEQKKLETQIQELVNQLKNINDIISKNSQGIYIPMNLDSFNKVLNEIKNAKNKLLELNNLHHSYLNKKELKIQAQNIYETAIQNIEYFNNDLNLNKKDLNLNISKKDNINKILDSDDFKDKKEQLYEVQKLLNILPNQKEKLIELQAGYKKDISYKNEQYQNIFKQNERNIELNEIYKEIFVKEYKLNYIYSEEIIDIDKTIKMIIQANKNKKETSVKMALDNLYSSYNHYKLELNDYNLSDINNLADYEKLLEKYVNDEEIKNIISDNTRTNIFGNYQGIKLSVIELSKKIENDIFENKNIISIQDRHLFEDILLNTIGDKIRDRIESSEKWVKKINSIMAKMQENSALSFKLVWKSIAASNEDEIDTRELVKILKMDPTMLRDSDREKLTNHFRSKIKHAEELYQDSYISFYKIVEDILDYRSWFSFQLQYQRKGMDFKELTDKTFSKFSGGERAKSMYIPLFASVYAKLNLASEKTLRLIALDEAFAGVDEENIREMFGILKYLDLNFVINSQALWGDYDTVDDLSICELIRPQNSSVVTVERYRWNGKYKEIVTSKDAENA